jgi:hypothetical protein
VDIFQILRQLVTAAAGRPLHEAAAAALHAHIDALDPAVDSPEVAARKAEEAQAAADKEQAEFAEFQRFKAAQAAGQAISHPGA